VLFCLAFLKKYRSDTCFFALGKLTKISFPALTVGDFDDTIQLEDTIYIFDKNI